METASHCLVEFLISRLEYIEGRERLISKRYAQIIGLRKGGMAEQALKYVDESTMDWPLFLKMNISPHTL